MVTAKKVTPPPDLRVREEQDRGKIRLGSRSVRVMAGLGTGVRYGVHANCLDNMVRGITERVLYVQGDEGLVRPPKPMEGVFKRLSPIRARLVKKVSPTPIVSREDYPLLFNGRRRRIYQSAADSLATRGLTVKDSYVDTFLKAEKINFDAKDDPAARTIQPRTPRYTLEVGRYLKLFEKELLHRGFERAFGYPVVVKGKNAQEVGSIIASHWERYSNPVAVGLDASRFDQHVSVAALEWEHSVYNAVFRCAYLRLLLRWQLRNRGIARVGGYRLDYVVEGRRMSGDINTSLGNCLLMSSIVLAYCEEHGLDARLVNNGDDCVLIMDRRDLTRLDGISKWFREFGFKLTRDDPVYILERIVFCQAQPVKCANGWRMVRDPRTAMSKDCVSLLSWERRKDLLDWCRAIGECGLSLTRGVPVWQAWYEQLVAAGDPAAEGVHEAFRERHWGMTYMARGVEGCEVNDEARYSFYRAFGILPDLQEALEAEYSSPLTIGDVTPSVYEVSLPIDAQNSLTRWLNVSRHNALVPLGSSPGVVAP